MKSDTLGFLQSLHIDAYTASGYSGYESTILSMEELLKLLQILPSLENFTHQKRILKSEFSQVSYGQKLYEKTLQKCLNPNIVTNKIAEVSFEDLLNYHQEWYQLHHMIAIDDQGKLLLDRGKGKTLKSHQPTLENFQVPSYHSFFYQGVKQEILVAKQGNPTTILVLDFFADFLDTLTYYTAHQKGQYTSPSTELSFTDSAFIITKDEDYHKTSLQKAQNFFPIFQEFYLTEISQNRKRAYIPHLALLHDVFIDQKAHATLVQSISFELISQLLFQFKCLKSTKRSR